MNIRTVMTTKPTIYQNKTWVYLIVCTVGRLAFTTGERWSWHGSSLRLKLDTPPFRGSVYGHASEVLGKEMYVPLAAAVITQAWSSFSVHWKLKVVMMPTLSSLVAAQVPLCDNILWQQWRQVWHLDNSWFSVSEIRMRSLFIWSFNSGWVWSYILNELRYMAAPSYPLPVIIIDMGSFTVLICRDI